MMSEFIDSRNERATRLFKSLDRILEGLEKMMKHNKPTLNGERYLTDREVSTRLKVSRRSLQDWRAAGKIPYIMLGGKTLYRESDIQAMLPKYHRKTFE